MTMATINLLLGIVSLLFALAVALGALAYAVEGTRSQGRLRRWNLVIAVVLAYFAWGLLPGVGQNFARASDATLLSRPADAGAFTAVIVWTLISTSILVAAVNSLRSLRRSSGTPA